jgi:hypothetical protein
MIERRNLADSLRSYIDARGFNVGFHGGAGDNSPTGGYKYYVPGANTSGDGTSWDAPYNAIATALAAMQPWDTLFCAPGSFSGDLITPINATAPFCSMIGMRATSRGFAAWGTSTTATEPHLSLRARGWRISVFEFDCPATNAGILLDKHTDGSTWRPDYMLAV